MIKDESKEGEVVLGVGVVGVVGVVEVGVLRRRIMKSMQGNCRK